jgi:hypothetical protein
VVVDEAVAAYLATVTERVVSVFAERAIGVWLLGSAAYGGFGPASDLDVQAATATPATSGEVSDLVERLTPDLAACPAEGLEFVLYDRAVLARPSPPLQWSLNLNGGPHRDFEASTDPTTESWHWFVLDLAIGRTTAVTLHGTDLAAVLGPIDDGVVRDAIAASLRWHDRNEADTPNQRANAVRGLRYLETGEWGSKPEALAWLEGTGRTPSQAVARLRAALAPR